MGERGVITVDMSSGQKEPRRGLPFRRLFTTGETSPFQEVEWERRSATILNEKGESVFQQNDVEVPKDWSQTATNIVAAKYFHGKPGMPERESSVKQLVGRVVDTIADWGRAGGYFASQEDAATFRDELTHLLVRQKVSFNSPVWFNCGVQPKPQCSACFINSIEDSMESILSLAKTEGMLFKWGSGTGTNFSTLRSSLETLSGGGIASGPVSFMRGFDAFAGVIKSGGKTRRAAKMVILNIDHPDVEEFIECKAKEERKAWALIEAGYDPSIDGDAYSSIFFQNANHSVRVTDEFMQAVVEDKPWWTKAITTGQPVRQYRARDLLRKLAESAHQCGDPGMQFDTTVNRWHTSKNTARINASNPCSEYMFLDNSACNLASLNLMKFLTPAGRFDVEAFRQAVDVTITAMEIIVGNASYPTEKIARNSHDYRPLGLGYANLGALLMSSGLPYDSDAARDVAGAITAVMTGQAYLTSARIAAETGSFPGFERNRDSMLGVIAMHRDAVRKINPRNVEEPLMKTAQEAWDRALEEGRKHGYRNAQASVIAPTGTIGFMMDCDTTGIEPDLALVKIKKLVGGGVVRIVNNTVPQALVRLGHTPEQISAIVDYIDENATIEGAPYLKPEHLPVFDCSFRAPIGARSIHYSGHLKMMAAVQPFISGAISKTVNLPEDATVEEMMQAYIDAWKLGLKAVALYRDRSKRVQPLSTASKEAVSNSEPEKPEAKPGPEQMELLPGMKPQRRRLPTERRAITHKFSIGGHDGYITVGLYEDGQPGEIFITMAKEGSTLSGVMDAFATAISIALQYGVPLKVLVEKLSHTRFEPSGWTGNPEIPYAKSLMDYIFRWLGAKFLSPEYAKGEPAEAVETGTVSRTMATVVSDAPTCGTCGSLMTRNGSCYKCENCGATSGCS